MPPIEGHESMVETEEKLALSGCHSASAERSLYWFNALVQIFKVRSEMKKSEAFAPTHHEGYKLLESSYEYFISVRELPKSTCLLGRGKYTPAEGACQERA